MPQSRKRKIENKPVVEPKRFDPKSAKWGKILIVVLCIAMVLGLLVAAVALMIQSLQ